MAQKLLPGSAPGGAIVKTQTSKISASTLTPNRDKFYVLKVKVIEVDKILKNSFVTKKKEEQQKVRIQERESRKKGEEKLEKPKTKEEKETSKLKLPGLSFLDRIKKFIFDTLAGFVLVRLVEHADKILPVVPLIGKTLDTIVDLTIGFVDGLGSFVKAGYDLYDSIGGWVKDREGEDALRKFDAFGEGLKNLINAALIVAMAQQAFKPDKPGAKPSGKPGVKPTKPLIRKPGQSLTGPRGNARSIQLKHGHAARGIFEQSYENAIKSGKTPKEAAVRANADVKKALKRGLSNKPGGIVSKPQTGSLAGADKGSSLMKGGSSKIGQRLGLRLFGKQGVQLVSKTFGRIPIMGPIIVAVASLLGGEPIGQALFKGVGAALGGLLGTFIPIPVLGTLIGETVGVFVGDLLYELLMGGGTEAAGRKLKQALTTALQVGGAIVKFFKEGFGRFFTDFPKVDVPKIGFGPFTLRKALAKIFPFLDEDKNGEIGKLPNLSILFNPLAQLTELIPHAAASFFPSIFGKGGTAFGTPPAPANLDGGEPGSGGTRTGSGGFTGTTSIGSGSSGDVVEAQHPETGKGWTVKGQMDAQGRPVVLSKPGAEAFARMIQDSGGRVKGSDVASSGRSKAKNDAVGGHQNSTHMYGEGLDIHGTSSAWMKQNDMRYGWKWASGYTGHSGHFNFKIRSNTFNPNVMDKGGKIGKGMFMNKGKPEFVIDADSTQALEDNFPGFLAALNKADYNGAIGVLRNYASYESMGGIQYIPVPIPVATPSAPVSEKSSTMISDSMSGGYNPMLAAQYPG